MPQNNRRGGISINGSFIGSFTVAAALIISAAIIGGNVSKLNKTVTEKTFSSSFAAPSDINVSTGAERRYLNEAEAVSYLNLSSSEELRGYISNGEITGYIINTGGSYSFDREALDKWFAQKCEKVGVPE